ncbi:Trp biosynthesis-associated membrane protein [Nonomuraea sp. NPDC023979]|uniref:Trp biosynthesis-associated membrane protein n=1 Tax=Nonomuraea sp. NPDC023979 TaxID=3154796 RepID=UPI00340E6E01
MATPDHPTPDRPSAPTSSPSPEGPGVPAGSPAAGDAVRAASPVTGGAVRERWVWLAVAAGGCLLVLLAASRPWAAGVREAGAAAELVAPTGGDLGPALTPLALAGLAGVVAVLATKGAGRRLMGALLALCGLAAGAATWAATGADGVVDWLRERNVLAGTAGLTWDDVVVWPVLCGLGAALVLAGGLAVVVRGGRWAGMSARYERDPGRAPRAADGDRALWDALDRGDDPTESR